MTLQEFKYNFVTALQALYPENEIHSLLKLLLKHRLNFSTVDIAMKPTYNIEQHDLEFLQHALAELKKEVPLQYILGETEFYGLPFKVTKDTLIPRPETEELVDWIRTDQQLKTKSETCTILDIGTGSGCIAIALAKHLPNAIVYALDVSKAALKIAKENATRNEVKINFIEEDILDPTVFSNVFTADITFDIIVSNPPYVRHLEKQEIKNNVLQYEPHQALFVADDEPLLFYDRIADLAQLKLAVNGDLFFEINQYLAVETQQLLTDKKFTTISLKKDLSDNYRMVKASF